MPLRVALLFLIASTLLFADQITLKNGDRLSGEIVKSDAKTLTMKSDFAGTVNVTWDAVTVVTTNRPLAMTLSDGQVVRGKVTTEGETFQVATVQTGTVTTAKSAVTSIRSEAEQKAYETQIERFRNPGMLDLWAGYLDAGLALTRGNARITTANTTARATRATPRDKIGVSFTVLKSTNSTSGVPETVANLIRGGVRYDVNIAKKAFAFGFNDLEFDEFQKLDLRFVVGGGGGYHVFKRDKSFLDLFGGASLNKEFFQDNIRRSSGEALLGDELVYAWKTTTFSQKFVIYPNLTRTGSYRVNWDSGAVTKINSWLSWQISVGDRFLSDPVPGARKNDVIGTTGIRLTFAR